MIITKDLSFGCSWNILTITFHANEDANVLSRPLKNDSFSYLSSMILYKKTGTEKACKQRTTLIIMQDQVILERLCGRLCSKINSLNKM